LKPDSNPELILIKLGGSLITDKNRPHTARPDVIQRLAEEIQIARMKKPQLSLIIGHGSGSFGHRAAKKYGTHLGVNSTDEWLGFVNVWQEANALNHIVLDILHAAGIPVIRIAPSAAVTAQNGILHSWDIHPLQMALKAGIVPVVYGDVIFDHVLGGTILSTEALFGYLAEKLHPQRMLLAGLEPGVWLDFPDCQQLIDRITPANYLQIKKSIFGSASMDVTGGMEDKVQKALELTLRLPNLETLIFSGLEPGAVTDTLLGKNHGTLICIDNQP
jgi:isopentenyl phosphate kinase